MGAACSAAGCTAVEVSKCREPAPTDPVSCLLAGESEQKKLWQSAGKPSSQGVPQVAQPAWCWCGAARREELRSTGHGGGIFWGCAGMEQQGAGARKGIWLSDSIVSSSDLYGPHGNTDLIPSDQSAAYLVCNRRAKRSCTISTGRSMKSDLKKKKKKMISGQEGKL